ncbi:hypothetical protein KA111_00555 [Candidatus Woesebacteria bacterium]|nr:hypothetical protein [Candidatus Woesebacteria bacterium]
MIDKELYLKISKSYGEFASWAIWAKVGVKPKSNIGNTTIFDLESNPDLLNELNPNIIMVGLNFSRIGRKECFANFHDSRPQGQDYKIRYAFEDTKFYGAYMTDIIKDFEEKVSGKVMSYLRNNEEFEQQNIKLFKEELISLNTKNPLIIAFGNDVYKILQKHFVGQYQIIKIPHYSKHISKEDYRAEVEKLLSAY